MIPKDTEIIKLVKINSDQVLEDVSAKFIIEKGQFYNRVLIKNLI